MVSTAAARRRTSRVGSGSAGAAAAWSVATVAIGAWWWAQPGRYPFGRDPEAVSGVLDRLPAGVVAPALVGAGVVGLAMAVLAGTRRVPALVGVVAAGYAIVFGVLVPGMQPVMVAGYLAAILGPPALFGTLVAAVVRRRAARSTGGGSIVAPVAVGVFVLLVVIAWATGFVDLDILRRYAEDLAGAAPRLEAPAYQTFLLAGGIGWALIAGRALLTAGSGRPAPAWTRPEAAARWGKVATLVAVACALPYGLLRMTWMTPWPFGFSAAELALTPEIRLHGLLLGFAALGGAVITYGLVAHWGEVWPRWMPGTGGRPVRVAAAVVPGGIVATLFCCAAIPFSTAAVEQGQPSMMVILPFPVWGPALGIAVLGYALRRRVG